MMRSYRRAILVLGIGAATAACSSSSPSSPSGEPSIRGTITAVETARVRIEANPADESGSPKALARIDGATQVRLASGERTTPSALGVGQLVSAWFIGPVLESYPVQATAAFIVIER